jgi:hypothetical protein
MIAELVTAANSLKIAGQIAIGLMNLKTTTEVQAKAIELNQLILSAQTELFAANAAQTSLIDEVRELKGEIARMKNWEAEKQRYELAAPFPGCMVYALKRSMSNGQPPHYLCTNCYQKGQPSILQARGQSGPVALRFAAYCCPNPNCKSEAVTRYTNVTAPQYFEDIKPAQ